MTSTFGVALRAHDVGLGLFGRLSIDLMRACSMRCL